jgi:outer membrane protein assembly factor BamB
LQQWPPGGPTLVWRIADAGYGFGTPSVAGDRIYLLGNEGLEDEFVRAFNVGDGKGIWSTRIGKVGNPNQEPNYPAARSTPTVDGDTLYAFGSDGDLVAIETRTGKIVWHRNVRQLGGAPGMWAYAESPLVDGDLVVVTPGGRAPMVAFDKRSGRVVWTTPVSDYGTAAYSSITIAETGGARQYVAILQSAVIGVDAGTGVVLWRDRRLTQRACQGAFPTPIFSEGFVYSACNGSGGALTRLRMQDGRVVASPVYQAALPGEKGGSVLIQGHLYGTNSQALFCIEFMTGAVKWRERGVGAASLACVDGRLYVRGESGEVALVEPSPEGYREKGRFTPDNSPENNAGPAGWPRIGAWPHPVVAKGRLYLRHLGTLWSYDVRQGN